MPKADTHLTPGPNGLTLADGLDRNRTAADLRANKLERMAWNNLALSAEDRAEVDEHIRRGIADDPQP